MSPLSEQRQARQKEMLLEQKRKLWNELREDIFRNTGEALNTQFEIPQDPGDLSLIDLLEDLQLSVADIKRQQLTKLDEALGKLERGSYGVCERCGENIGEKRLKVMPFATHCLQCQKGEEAPNYPPEPKI